MATTSVHWMARVARAAGLPGADSLQIPVRVPAQEAWATTVETCGVDEQRLAELVAGFFRLDIADLTEADPSAMTFLPGSVTRRFNVFPLHEEDRHLLVATADPTNVLAEQQIGFASGRTPRLLIAPASVIAEYVDATYSPDKAVAKLLDSIETPRDPRVQVLEEEAPPDEPALVMEDDAGGGPIVKLTDMILEDAVMKSASDIHLQPLPTGGVIRLRIDGVLRSGISVPLPVLARVISRVKIISGLDISDRMRPQDGRTRIRVADHKYDLRVSTVPVRGGEKAVIRILDPSGSGALDDSGLPAREVQGLRRILRNRDGILVVTGPTGSGKTTTMYAALREIASEDVNIMTVEDPVEYELPGLTQIQVDPKQGVTFQTALKAILRQDPDVIFVGEIRDQATVEMAAQASLTGHLVLATVHANDAVGSIRRFLDLGLDAGTIAETLRGAVAQRLLRTLCTDCAQPVAEDLTARERSLADRFGVEPTMRPVGCEACGQSGYRGRRPVVELIVPSQEILGMVAEEAPHLNLLQQARRDGMRSMLEGALDLVTEGLTTLEEVERVIGEESTASSSSGGAHKQAPTPPEAAHGPTAEAAAPDAPPTVAPPAAPRKPTVKIEPPAMPPRSASAAAKATPPRRPPAGTPSEAPPPRRMEERPQAPVLVPDAHDDFEHAPRALVVDDDQDTRLVVRVILESHGWTVREAPDGQTAIAEMNKDRDLSLVVLDLGLPDIDGLEVLGRSRRSMETAGIPIVVLTGRTDRDTERQVLLEGADDYIRKPIDPLIFLTRAKAVMRRSRRA